MDFSSISLSVSSRRSLPKASSTVSWSSSRHLRRRAAWSRPDGGSRHAAAAPRRELTLVKRRGEFRSDGSDAYMNLKRLVAWCGHRSRGATHGAGGLLAGLLVDPWTFAGFGGGGGSAQAGKCGSTSVRGDLTLTEPCHLPRPTDQHASVVRGATERCGFQDNEL